MAQPVQLIYGDSPGALAASYDLPASLDMLFASSRARINGAGAASSFVIALELLSSDNRIITQARIDKVFAVGDTGALTWAPFLRGRPQQPVGLTAAVQVIRDTAVSVPTGFAYATTISFEREVYDFGDMWDAGTPDVVTLPVDGFYFIATQCGFVSNAVGGRSVRAFANGAGVKQTQAAAASGIDTFVEATTIKEFAAGTTVSMQVQQNSGGALNTTASSMSMFVFLMGVS